MKRKIKCKENNKLNIRKDFISTKAITLITLVITIIILIILAGVIINISIGENGIFNKVKQAKNAYNESTAREKLELVLEEARIDKETTNEYNSDEYLDELLESKGITVNENEVIVDNYNFKIDRENLTVTESLGETAIKITAKVQEYLGKNANDKYEASILLVVESNSSLQKVTIQNPDGTTIEMETDKEQIGKYITVEFDEEYIITVTTKDGKSGTRKIIEKTEEIIRTAKELAEFRDKVNTPLTYEGKIIKLGNDIDLGGICGESIGSFEPIGGVNDYVFMGNFDGQYNKIRNLYIDSNLYPNVGLFIENSGQIENVILEEVNIYNNNLEYNNIKNGGISATNTGNIVNCGVNSGCIKYKGTHNSASYLNVGGIVGVNKGLISNCYNNATIIVENTNNSAVRAFPGGIIGRGDTSNSKVKDCYNKGKVIESCGSTVSATGGIGGAISDEAIIENCYNYGIIEYTGSSLAGGICGRIFYAGKFGKVINSYCINNTPYAYYSESTEPKTTGRVSAEVLQGYSSKLGESFIEDEKTKVIDEQTGEEKEVWKYNNGYPVLKWQVGK